MHLPHSHSHLHQSFSTVLLTSPCFAHHQLQLRDTSFHHPCFCGNLHCQHPLVVMFRVGTFYMTIPPNKTALLFIDCSAEEIGGPCRSSIRSRAVPQNICKVSKRSFSWVHHSGYRARDQPSFWYILTMPHSTWLASGCTNSFIPVAHSRHSDVFPVAV